MATAGDIIKGSLRLIGQLAEGEEPSADTAQDSLASMNQMIESWNTERLAVYATQTQVFNWPVGVASRTLGPTGDFVGQRPVQVDAATYFKDGENGLSSTKTSTTASLSRHRHRPFRRLSLSTTPFPMWRCTSTHGPHRSWSGTLSRCRS
jgi:hypothetical protein